MLYITSQWLTYFTTGPQFFIFLEVLCCCFHIWRGVTTSGPYWLTSGEKHPLWAVLGILTSLLWGRLLHTSSCGRMLKHTYLLWILQSLAECWQNPFAFSRGMLNGPACVFSRACRLGELSAQAPLLPECVLTAVSACTGKQGTSGGCSPRDEVSRQGRDFNWGASWRGKVAGLCLKIAILPGPGCQDVLWIRDEGEVRKQSKKTIQSLQMSPRMATLRQGNVLVSLPYSLSQVGSSCYLPEAGHCV